MNTFFVGPKIYDGCHSLDHLKELKIKRVCIVTDRMMVGLGMTEKIATMLQGASCTVFSDVEPNPSLDTVKKGLTIFL